MALEGVEGGEGGEEVDDLAGVGPAVAVVAEEDDEGGGEGGGAHGGLEFGPEAAELVGVAVDVADADHRPDSAAGAVFLHWRASLLHSAAVLKSA